MKKLKVMTIAGTRPELIRLSEIIKKADIFFEHIFERLDFLPFLFYNPYTDELLSIKGKLNFYQIFP